MLLCLNVRQCSIKQALGFKSSVYHLLVIITLKSRKRSFTSCGKAQIRYEHKSTS
jgi:hypothetical protein